MIHPPRSQGEGMGLRTAMVASVRGGAMRRKGPLPDGTRVDMNELTFWIVTYTTRAEGKGGIPQLHRWNARNPDIERIRFDMLGVLSSVGGSTLAECVVGFLGSVAAKDLNDAA